VKLAVICRPFVFHGGLERATAGLIDELVRRGHEVHLLTTGGQEAWPGVVLHHLPVVRHPSLLRLLSFAFSAAFAARRGEYDIVQSHERTLVHDLYRAGEGCHRGYLAEKASRLKARGRLSLYANPYHRAVLALERRIFTPGRYRHLIAISKLSEREIRSLYGVPEKDITVVYNGVDLTRFTPENRDRHMRSVREELGVPSEAWTVLFVGSGFERKGLGPLIEGFARLGDRSARLLVAGKGDTRKYRSLADRLGVGGRVIWAGARPDIERLYGAADAVALPAFYEPFGNVHLEALASGLPLLASARSGGAELVTRAVNGQIVSEPSDPVEIASALESLRDPPLGGWSAPARAAALPFTHAAQADALDLIYLRVAAQPGA
jgi:UDP-glucose:(heptosyl)LPS alpha-1,3-glucosyltransferase